MKLLLKGKTETTFWQNGMRFPLPLVNDVTALDMLDGIELYASACYDNTQHHLTNTGVLSTVRKSLLTTILWGIQKN